MKRFVLVALIVVAACARGTTFGDSGIDGVIFVGPTCPVETVPPQPECTPRTIAMEFAVVRSGTDTAVARGRSDQSGGFRVILAPGSYTIQSEGPGPPTIKPLDVVVRAHTFTQVKVNADSGIR